MLRRSSGVELRCNLTVIARGAPTAIKRRISLLLGLADEGEKGLTCRPASGKRINRFLSLAGRHVSPFSPSPTSQRTGSFASNV